MKEQLNVRLDAALARQLKQEAQEQGRTVGGIVALALEAWLAKASGVVAGASSSPAPPPSALAALEARVAKLEAMTNPDNIRVENNDENKGDNVTFKKGDNVTRFAIDQPGHNNVKSGKSQSTAQGGYNVTPSQGLTTAELAIQTNTNKGAWNTWASKATIGDIRRHAQAGSWRLLGKAAPASGGPERWMWEPAG